jgi:hypothetical protein
MNGGEILDTAAITSTIGGGVNLSESSTFTKSGGTIYGYDSADTINSNIVKTLEDAILNDKGHSVYRDATTPQRDHSGTKRQSELSQSQ